ncbi:MAG: hypothetical protein KDD73_00950 [Anaerolineales bacterium]|nr:hypothetical protein [Anaerolineales bacterium]MCB9129119.1 hypothetical protein [Ardenticatenales bacterium]
MSVKINPLSRRPKQQRLVLAVRGAAGSGKSVFAASLADAGLGRLCFFDTERKGRLLPGSDGSHFDAIEVRHPDELPEFIDWALDGEGREQNYGCYALDSWAMYFGRKHRETLEAVRQRTGDPTAQPTAEELQSDQILFQEVLRRLCIDSGACVVITDQIAARGKEEREENELGRVLPMTASGLEYFVDVMIELAMKIDGFEQVRVARVVKSNSPAFPVGMTLKNPTFSDFLAQMADGPVPPPAAEEVDELLEVADAPVERFPTLEELLEQAAHFGLAHADVALASRYHCGTSDLEQLTPQQVKTLLERLLIRYGAEADVVELAMEPATNGNGRTARKRSAA